MDTSKDAIEVAWKAGQYFWTKANGNPAMLVAGAVVAGTTLIGYGSYVCGEKVYRALTQDG
ncbi:MAG: hypothetical protein JXR59_11815 [Desulfuromonadaceae bacterium]|nr:hypothetical protein [Desulfuromonadaceae bacterium]